MSFALVSTLVEQVGATPAGSTTFLPVSGPDEVDVVHRWCDNTGNAVLAVHPDGVEIHRGRIVDPIAALPADRRPGHRLWVYTNFHCNLACDYCCVSSSPRAQPRTVELEDFDKLMAQAEAAGVAEVYLTGGEPFLLLDLDERIRRAVEVAPTTVLTNAMVWTGERRRRLEALDRDGVTLQISLDSATPELHDRHRGEGSYAKALAGIRLALELGFRIRVAATLGAEDHAEAEALEGLFDELELEPDQRVVRTIAAQGMANAGLTVSRASLLPEVCVTADGVWWHPVAATDPTMLVADSWDPLELRIAEITDELREARLAGEVLASTFPCA